MTGKEFLTEYVEWFPEKQNLCEEHISEFSEILPHIFAMQTVNIEINKAFQNGDTKYFERLCRFVDHLWHLVCHDDNDEILNVIDVTILESISDDKTMWQRFGSLISGEFREYINKVVLTGNVIMVHVENLQ